VFHVADPFLTIYAVSIEVGKVLTGGHRYSAQAAGLHAARHQLEGEKVAKWHQAVAVTAQTGMF